jgi:multiple sugar transport system substrate-binding protein
MDRRRFLLTGAATAATAATTLTPTLSAGARTTPRSRSRASTTTVTFSLWMTGQERTTMVNLLQSDFQKRYPNITVKIVDVAGPDWGREKLETLIAGGTAPDVMQLNTGQFEAFAARGALLDLGPYFKRDKIDMNAYVTGTWPGCEYQGKIYGTPRFLSVHCTYYNKDLFRAAGVPFPTNAWDWNDFRAKAIKLTNPKKHVWGVGLLNDVWQWGGAFVQANGGGIISADRKKCLMDDPRTIEALDFYFGLQFRDHAAPPPGSLPPAQNWSGAMFQAQSVAMAILGPWFRPGMAQMTKKFDWDIVLSPRSPRTHKPGSFTYVDQWSAATSTPHAEETWALVNWLGSPEFHQAWLKAFGASSLDAVKAVINNPAWMHYDNHSGQIFVEEAKYSVPPPVNFGNGGRVQDVWNQEIALLQIGQESAKDAVAKIVPKVNAILAGA